LGLLVHPILLGSGRRLFEGGEPPARLRLVDCKKFKTGVTSLRYATT
jgi:dihydrofolate reductase